jgi:signal transduction histidine kinase
MRRLDLRDRLTLVVTIAAALVLTALTVGFNITLRSSLDGDANQVLSARASAALDTLRIRNGTIRGVEAPDRGDVDTLLWVYAGGKTVERPRAPTSVQAAAHGLGAGPRRFAQDSGDDVGLLSVPVERSGQRLGTLVVGLSLVPYERSESRALIASIVFAAVIFLLVVVAARMIIGSALRPVARMTAEAADWSERDLDHRFHAGEPHDELTRLAATFDAMLDRLAASLRHEQRFSAEVSHELRTPLSAIAAEAELALRRHREAGEYREAIEAIASRATQLQQTLETLLASARAETGGMGTADAEAVAARVKAACAPVAAERGIELRVAGPRSPLRIGMDEAAAERVLAPLVENACRYAARRVDVVVRANGDTVEYVVADDGPGVAEEETELIFEPGRRGSAGAAAGNGAAGAGLGLALARRLARAADGEVTYVAAESGFLFQAPRV